MTQQAIKDELARANALLRKREGKPGFAANVASIKARIAELQEVTPDDG